MFQPILDLTPCQYLFGRDLEEVFPQTIKRFSTQLINDTLATLIKVSEYLITKKEAFILFDPTAFNNQCHLYALMTAQIAEKAKIDLLGSRISPQVPSAKPASNRDSVQEVDVRFVHLSFLLGYSILTDASLLGKIVKKIPKEIIGETTHSEKDFEVLIKDPTGERTRATRIALSNIFKAYISSSFSSQNDPIYRELITLANDPRLLVPYGTEKLYTLPKFAGVAYFIDTIARKQIPLMFKVKVLTKERTGFFCHSDKDLRGVPQDSSVIVFEMIAYDEALTREKCLEITKRCPQSSERDVKSKNRHDTKERCLFCNPAKVDITPYKARYLPALRASSDMLFALGVAFIQERQPQFQKFFSDSIAFPILTKMFHNHAPNVERLGLASTKASNIYVSHVFVDCAEFAERESMIMDAPYKAHLRARGVI